MTSLRDTPPGEALELRSGRNGSGGAGVPDRPSVERPLLLGLEWFAERPGGLNRYLWELHAALERGGLHPQTVVLGPVAGAPAGVQAAGSRTDSLPRRLRSFSRAAGDLAVTSDLVDAHFALHAFLPLVAGSLRARPFVVHFQGPWAEESWAAGDRSHVRRRARRAVERAVYRRAREIVVLSHAFKRILVEQYGIVPWAVSVLPPGVDLEQFSPGSRESARARLGLPADAWLAVCVRRLVPRMGVDALLAAWARLDWGDSRGLLVIAGDGPAREELERRTRELDIAADVRFIGAASDEEVVELYRAADVCVVPSLELEGFGLVVLEALACGTPVVGTDAGGLGETLSRLDPSLMVAAGDEAALADRLQRAVDGVAPLPGAVRCRAFADAFDWSEVARRHRELYDRAAFGECGRRKLRVVFLDHCAQLSGAELALLRLLPALHELEPHVILAEDGPLVSRLLRAGISVEVLPMGEAARALHRDSVTPRRLPLRSVLSTCSYVLRLRRRLRKLQPDLVQTNSLKAAVYGSLAAQLARLPVVVHTRDRVSEDYLPHSAVRLVRLLARRIPVALAVNSQSTLEALGVEPRTHRSFPDAVRVMRSPIIGSERGFFDRDGFRVGMVGRLAPWKGQHVLLRALAEAFPDGSAEGVIVGAPMFGEEPYEHELHRLVEELGLDARIEFTGFVEDVGEQLARLDLLVHASVIPEPFGQVVLEGMAAGLPVVAPAAGGPAEVIDDDVTGVLYPPGDVHALAGTLRELAYDPTRRRRLGEAARARAEEYTPEAIAPKWIDFYRDILAACAIGVPLL